ncbi:Pentatricopeptide repeat-containing protein [Spatholobus suberectus]|nr:Pentatricopeptide repeat-containing protein [Spatholobus suberectus]
MSVSIAHCLHQPRYLPRASANKVGTLHHHSHHPAPIVSVAQSPTLSKDHRGQPLIDLLKSCEESGSLKQANCIHGLVLKSGFGGRDLLVLLNHAAHAYSKCNDYDAARRVFDGMSHRNVFSWTVMIVASNEHGHHCHGVDLFCMMLDQGALPDGFAFSAVLQSCVGLDSVELGEMVHAHVVVTGYSQAGSHIEALQLFTIMCQNDIKPDVYTFCCVFNSIAALKCLKSLRETHGMALRCGFDAMQISATNALADAYAKCDSLEAGENIFNRMEEKDIPTLHFFQNGKKADELTGADVALFNYITEKLLK